MRKFILIILCMQISLKLFSQINLNDIANGQYHKVAQIEGTEDILIDYFSKITNKNDTLYVFISPLMASPRMDGNIPTIQEMLYYKNPNNPMLLIALFPAVNGYFFIPNYPTIVAAINFDRTGTTKIGKYILNHSFMMPGLVATIVAIGVGILMIQLF